MFTSFEEYALSNMLGNPDSPPRTGGRVAFSAQWQREVFGLTLAISKEGHFEWEDFRQQLIRSIAEWEGCEDAARLPWNYYQRFLLALVRLLQERGMLTVQEVERQLCLQVGSDG
ncbi:MAG TPA: nitrile hydratase accessory protein [Steroidobacteraceae bacterium]|nr:nitrile hydratase accessory protein [Steroidobacteraceae bacterium]